MKTINISFEDAEFKKILARKGNKTWRDFILPVGEKR
jgi:hypothetical protein